MKGYLEPGTLIREVVKAAPVQLAGISGRRSHLLTTERESREIGCCVTRVAFRWLRPRSARSDDGALRLVGTKQFFPGSVAARDEAPGNPSAATDEFGSDDSK